MSDNPYLNDDYSTTKLLINKKPNLNTSLKDSFESHLFLEKTTQREEGGLRTKNYYKHTHIDKPLVSIITVVFNGDKHLERTINSVITQSYDNIEYLIIDGGSTDGTLNIIRKNEDKIDYWISEKDYGIYHAMNKGIRLSQGTIIGMINADDYYLENTIEDIVNISLKNKVDIIYGDMLFHKVDKQQLVKAHSFGLKNNFFPYSLHWILLDMLFPHPSSFITMQCYQNVGLYDDSFKIAADYDFVLRAYKKNASFFYLEQALSIFSDGGISTCIDHNIIKSELDKARYKNLGFFNSFLINTTINILLLIKKSYRKLL